jgi:hypothetical protein
VICTTEKVRVSSREEARTLLAPSSTGTVDKASWTVTTENKAIRSFYHQIYVGCE